MIVLIVAMFVTTIASLITVLGSAAAAQGRLSRPMSSGPGRGLISIERYRAITRGVRQ
jgi:hypothetical protein